MRNFLQFPLFVLCFLGSRLLAFGQELDTTMWVTDEAVYKIIKNGNTIYLGGNFSYVGPRTGNGVILDKMSGGLLEGRFPKVEGAIYSAAADGKGGWFITGEFTAVQNVAQRYLAHISADGTLDQSWRPQLDNWVSNAILSPSGKTLYVNGSFTTINGQSRTRLASIDAATGEVSDWNPAPDGLTGKFALSGDTLYVGGNFTKIGGKSRSCIAAFSCETGSLYDWNATFHNAYDGSGLGSVHTIAVSANTVYVGGEFTSVGGLERRRLAALDATTGQPTSWNPGVDGSIYALLVHKGLVYVGGHYNNVGGQQRNSLCAINASGAVTTWHPDADRAVNAMVISGDQLLVGGEFQHIGGKQRNRLAALELGTGQVTSWRPNANGYVRTLALYNNSIYAGGYFNSAGGQNRNYLAAIDDRTGRVLPWMPVVNYAVTDMKLLNNSLYMVGAFTTIGDKLRNYAGAIDIITGQVTPWNPNPDDWVSTLGYANNTFYLLGRFEHMGGQLRNGLAAVSTTTGQVTPWNPQAEDYVNAMAVTDSVVYLGGTFYRLAGQRRENLAAVDAITGKLTAWAPYETYVQNIKAIQVVGNTLYIGGSFNHRVGGAYRKSVAALDIPSGKATSWNPVIGDDGFGDVSRLTVAGNTVYISGSFSSIGGQARRWLGAIDARTGVVTPWNPLIFGDIRDMLVVDDRLYLGGSFTAENRGMLNFAAYGKKANPTVNLNFVSGTAFADENQNCTQDGAEKGIPDVVVVAEPGPYYGITDSSGKYVLAVDTGSYTIRQVLSAPGTYSSITQTCPVAPATHQVALRTYNNTVTGKDFGNQVVQLPHLTASVSSSRRRRCFTSTTTLSYCNTGSAAATNIQVHLQLPRYVVLVSASAAYTRYKDGHYVFSPGELAAGQCGNIQVRDSVVCNDPNIRSLTQCTKVWITPANGTAPSPNWDKSDITLKARCLNNGAVRLALYNTGTGNMADSAAFRILLDAGLALQGKYKLAAGDSLILRVPANGRTVRLEADQRPGHPTKQSTNVTLEACGTNAKGGVSLGFVAQLPGDDAEPEVAEECLPITDSYDPNDKLVRPAGTTPEHYTPTGAALSYTVRFQNTGNDYAYKVVVVDTLAAELDLSTLQIGAVSHPYKFTVSGKGRLVLTFTFDDIMLPDSTRDGVGSNGFIQFSIKPLADLPEKTRIENFADIFFDYNPPIRTNTVFNRIYDVPPVVAAADRLVEAAVVATPVITGFTPTTGTAGTVVTLTGMHFDPVPARNRVTFNGIAATVTAATATTLAVTVPPGEVTGRIGVTTPDGAARSATDFSLLASPPTAVSPGPLAGLVRIYPNPAPGRFVVEFAPFASGVIEIVTLDARGQRVHTLPLAGKPATRAEIDLTGHPAGMYLVLIRTERGITTRKVTLRP